MMKAKQLQRLQEARMRKIIRYAYRKVPFYKKSFDAAGAKTIAVMPIPHQGLGEAINDRLARAAAPR